MIAGDAVTAITIGLVVVEASFVVRPVSPTPVVASGANYDVVRQPASTATTQQESISREKSFDVIEMLMAIP
jgi:hypothetical protein